jgi:hypothetical protein
VGTFQYFYARQDRRLWPPSPTTSSNATIQGVEGAMGLLRAVTERQARLVAH